MIVTDKKLPSNFSKLVIGIVFCTILAIMGQHGAYATTYSFQHAEDLKHLINWQDYGPDAFAQAKQENKPILLLLTAPSWCYYCQVYESEDYLYNPDVVKLVNQGFVPIYVDSDERQDLTRQYLEGGWPSTTVLAPDGQRLFGYSGPRPVQNMLANFQETLAYVNSHNFTSKISLNYTREQQVVIPEKQLEALPGAYANYNLNLYDTIYGGFGTGEKFPEARTLDFFLDLYQNTGNKAYLNLVQNTLRNQYTNIQNLTDYKLFDPIDGGFHRYGTTRTWSPPHYEKMLYDNAKLLKTYEHLLLITPDDPMVSDVVNKTGNYIEKNWYDTQNGGFYGDTDSSPEEAYYMKNPRPAEKPGIDKTKFSDWNSEAIIAYLYMYNATKNPKYKEIADNSLLFFENNMVSDKGVYHYQDANGTRAVRGSLLDNSYMLLAFVDGYDTLGNPSYLQTAQTIANYTLDNLYDWYSGGFFERNSPDTNLYPQGQQVNLAKPSEENGIISYALLRLYKDTNDIAYLDSAIKTIGNQADHIEPLDEGYYYVKAAQFVHDNNIMLDFENDQDNIGQIEKQNQENFWLNNMVNNTTGNFVQSQTGLDNLQGPLFLLVPVAVFSGFISFASPCTLPILPAYVAYTFRASKMNIIGMSACFFFGLSIIFVLLGMSATLAGAYIKSNIGTFSEIAGIAMIFFGLYTISGRGISILKITPKSPATYFGAFAFGCILGMSWTPCVGPILVGILLLAATTASISIGGLLLFSYAAGLAIPLMLVSVYVGRVNQDGIVWKIIRGREFAISLSNKKFVLHTSSLLSGALFVILGYLVFVGILYSLNQYVEGTSVQQWFFEIEDRILQGLH
ncbi:MAG: cytochrome c biogenesis protein CcdA [Nitrosotalea sp.]